MLNAMAAPQQVQSYPGIQIAGTSSHHEAACRSKPHAGIYGLSFLQRHHAGAVAQMSDDGTPSQILAHSLDHVLIRKPVEAIASHSLLPELARKRKSACDLRNLRLEGGIKACDLSQVRIVLRNRFNQSDLARHMYRRENRCFPQPADRSRVNKMRRRKPRTAVHNAMPRAR